MMNLSAQELPTIDKSIETLRQEELAVIAKILGGAILSQDIERPPLEKYELRALQALAFVS